MYFRKFFSQLQFHTENQNICGWCPLKQKSLAVPHVFESVVCYIRNVRSKGTLMVMIKAEVGQQQPWERLLTHVNICVWRQQGYRVDKVIFIQCYSLVLISSWQWRQKCRRRVLSLSSCALSNLPSAWLLTLDTIKDIQDIYSLKTPHGECI